MGKNPDRQQLIQVARLFKNDQVLDNLSRPQLVAMCNYMNLRPFGTDSILRYQIRHRLLNIIKDDKVIDYEGVDSLSILELQLACLQRGIKTSDKSPARLRDDLETWLDLRLRQKIPSTLLICLVHTRMEIKGIPLSHITMHYWLCCPLFLTKCIMLPNWNYLTTLN